MLKRLSVYVLPLLVTTPVFAYEVKMAGDQPVRWADGVVPVHIELDDAPLVSGSARAAAEAAVATFSSDLGVMEAGVVPSPDESDDAPVSIHWVRENWDVDYIPEALAVTVTSYDPSTGAISDARIYVDADGTRSWQADADGMNGCVTAFDLQTALTHELGHAFGLSHSSIPRATMYPSVSPCESEKRSLDEDDLQALQFLYVETPPLMTGKLRPFGCAVSAGGGGSRGAPAVLLIGAAALFLTRRRRAMVTALALTLAVTGAGAAQATTLRRLGLDDLARKAALVARAEVVAVRETVVGDRHYVDADMRISECLKGDCDATVTVRQLGGAGVIVEGSAAFSQGSTVLVYLRPRLDGAYGLVGMAQGSFRVERQPAGKPPVLIRELKGLSLVGGEPMSDGGEGERVPMELIVRSIQNARDL